MRSDRSEASGFVTLLAWQCWRLLSLRSDWKSLPDSAGFTWLTLGLMLVGGLTEQLVRGHSLGMAILSTLSWLGLILVVSRRDGRFDGRLAAALALLSIGIEVLLILAIWLPAADAAVAIWSGIAVMHLLLRANAAGAEAGR